MGEGVVFFFSFNFEITCRFLVVRIGWIKTKKKKKKTSNDDIVRHISLHELEYLFMSTPLM